MLESIFDSAVLSPVVQILLSYLCSIILGCIIAAVSSVKSSYSKSFIITLAVMPALVQTVIFLVNGNVGAGVATLGAFSLVRFRSVPGSAKEIAVIFFSMAVGLAIGLGYLLLAALFTLIISIALIIFSFAKIGSENRLCELRITLPENLNFNGLFDDLFERYTKKCELIRVKTINMGSMFELRYHITLAQSGAEKEFIDELRTRNGNLSISLGIAIQNSDTL